MSVRDIVMSAAGQGGENLYVEDVFQTWLRTGTGADVTVTNNVDMTEGYMLWTKGRSGATDHAVYDSERGVTKDLVTNSTAAETTQSTGLKAVSSTGYTIGSLAKMNTSGATYADWVFRKAPKFFDVVTYTGTGANRTVAHNLGSVPGMIIVKRTDTTGSWIVYHNSVGSLKFLKLNTTGAEASSSLAWNNTAPTDSEFTLGFLNNVNESGGSYVAYLFAHDAGGFGDTGDESVVACGSYTGTGSAGNNVTLGWEPQFVLVKKTNEAEDWNMVDMMRGMPVNNVQQQLRPNSSGTESAAGVFASPTANGFEVGSSSNDINDTYIYLAIRRPMKTPESGTEVFAVNVSSESTRNFGIVPDSVIAHYKPGASTNFPNISSRLTGNSERLLTSSTEAAGTNANWYAWDKPNGFWGETWGVSWPTWAFRRAPGFFDVVCYTGTGSTQAVPHNLGVAPELMIIKHRNGTNDWQVYNQSLATNQKLVLNSTGGASVSIVWSAGAPTASVINLVGFGITNGSGGTYVAYLFASVPGVSKVGSYTGNGSSQTINCGFTTGARFFLVKAASTTGSWWVYDSARGIISAADPALQLNSTAAEVTSADAVDPDASGIIVNQEATCSINASGVTYIFLAIA